MRGSSVPHANNFTASGNAGVCCPPGVNRVERGNSENENRRARGRPRRVPGCSRGVARTREWSCTQPCGGEEKRAPPTFCNVDAVVPTGGGRLVTPPPYSDAHRAVARDTKNIVGVCRLNEECDREVATPQAGQTKVFRRREGVCFVCSTPAPSLHRFTTDTESRSSMPGQYRCSTNRRARRHPSPPPPSPRRTRPTRGSTRS